jgi:hypothetical protein
MCEWWKPGGTTAAGIHPVQLALIGVGKTGYPVSPPSDPQRPPLRGPRLGNPGPPYSLRPIGLVPQGCFQPPQLVWPVCQEVTNRLVVHPRRSLVRDHAVAGHEQVQRGEYLVDQRVPSSSLHSGFECGQHAVCPDARVGPIAYLRRRSGRSSRQRHCDRCGFPASGHSSSTFLRPLAPPALTGFFSTTDALTPDGRAVLGVRRYVRSSGSRRGPEAGPFSVRSAQHRLRAESSRPLPTGLPSSCHRVFRAFCLQPPLAVPGSVCFRPGLTVFYLDDPVCRERTASWASPVPSRLATTTGRIEFLIVRTARSPPVASHPSLRRRSYFRLQSSDQL